MGHKDFETKVDKSVLLDVIEVEEIGEVKVLNQYLKKGWKLINIFNRAYEDSDFKDQFCIYCVGWTDKTKKPEHPFQGLKVEFD